MSESKAKVLLDKMESLAKHESKLEPEYFKTSEVLVEELGFSKAYELPDQLGEQLIKLFPTGEVGHLHDEDNSYFNGIVADAKKNGKVIFSDDKKMHTGKCSLVWSESKKVAVLTTDTRNLPEGAGDYLIFNDKSKLPSLE